MKNALRPVAALLIGVAILLTGLGLQGTLLPVRASLEAFSTLAIGTMGAAYFLGFTLGCLKGGQLVKSVGHVRVFLAMTALASSVPLIHGLILNPLAWGLLRFLTGLCFAILFLVIESWLNERSTNENRGIVFSTYVMITLTVLAAGQMMTLLYDPTGLELFLIASVLVSLGAIPVALSKSPTPEVPLETEVNLKRLFKISPAGMLGCLATGLANGSFWALAPLFTSGISSNPSLAAWFMSCTVIGGAFAQWPLGFLSDKIGRRKTLALSSVACAIVATIIWSFSGTMSFTTVNLLGGIWGFFAFPLYAIAVAHANDSAEPTDYVMVSSGLLLMYGAGAVIGPIVTTLVITMTDYAGLYILTAGVHATLAVYVLLRVVRRGSSPEDHHIPFGDALATAHTASQIYEEEFLHNAEE